MGCTGAQLEVGGVASVVSRKQEVQRNAKCRYRA
jgi:hypothetical protein